MAEVRRVLGIDPGLAAGTFRTRAKDRRAARLAVLYDQLTALIEEHRPQDVALEQHFVANNVRSAMVIGEARAAAMIAAARAGIEVYEYSPATVKESVCGFGAAGKEQVQAMVRMHLGLAELPQPLDTSDALAVALTRLAAFRMDTLLAASR
jgi:crossover junction endodeoxyribonuclease RuvC